jgi:hypothetical protein
MGRPLSGVRRSRQKTTLRGFRENVDMSGHAAKILRALRIGILSLVFLYLATSGPIWFLGMSSLIHSNGRDWGVAWVNRPLDMAADIPGLGAPLTAYKGWWFTLAMKNGAHGH